MAENSGYSAVDQIGNKKNKRHVVTGAVAEIAVNCISTHCLSDARSKPLKTVLACNFIYNF